MSYWGLCLWVGRKVYARHWWVGGWVGGKKRRRTKSRQVRQSPVARALAAARIWSRMFSGGPAKAWVSYCCRTFFGVGGWVGGWVGWVEENEAV